MRFDDLVEREDFGDNRLELARGGAAGHEPADLGEEGVVVGGFP